MLLFLKSDELKLEIPHNFYSFQYFLSRGKVRRFRRFFDETQEIRLFSPMNNDTMNLNFHHKGLNTNASPEAIDGGANADPLSRDLGNLP